MSRPSISSSFETRRPTVLWMIRASTYETTKPFFDGGATVVGDILNARPLGIFGDSVTTDHISPAGSIKADSPAGRFLIENGVPKAEFNSYGARRGNDRVMTRGTFANVRIKNLMCPGTEGGYTVFYHEDRPIPESGRMLVTRLDLPKVSEQGIATHIYDASMAYQNEGVPLIIIGGDDYGMGSSRDWAAKGTRLLGVSAVVTKSFERIHRSNLIGMGVLPLNFINADDYDKVKHLADARFDITGIHGELKPMQDALLVCHLPDHSRIEVPLKVRLDTPAR